MEISVKPVGEGRFNVDVLGDITVKTYRQLTEVVESLSQETPPPTRVTLDMQAVDYIDSVGLGSLIKVFTTVKRAGGVLVISNAPLSVRESLAMTRLDQLLELE